MTGSQRKGLLSDALAMMLLAGCATTDPKLASRDAQDFDRLTQAGQTLKRDSSPRDNTFCWDGDGLSCPAEVRIDLDEQRAYFYKGGKLAGISTVSTGRDGYCTPPGTFRITQKQPHHRSNLYGSYVNGDGDVVATDVDVRKDPAPPGTKFLGAPMPNFMRFNGGIGMHAGYLPGYAASHGCVRLPPKMARHFFDNVSIGTPVTVVN
jgi:L,D-transpeptidase catalytic domain